MSFDRFKSDMGFDGWKSDLLKDTYDLIDDIKSGRGVDMDKCFDKFFSRKRDDFFSSDFDDFTFPKVRRNRTSNVDSRFRTSFPNFTTRKSRVETDDDPFSDGSKFQATRIRRSESTYSTSSYDTTDSNDTVSEDSSFSPTSSRGRSSVHNRTSSSDSSTKTGDLGRKLEDEFLNDERHSMPYEIYSKCNRYLNDLDIDRPRSVPPDSAYSNLLNENKERSGSNYKYFPSNVNSESLKTHLSNVTQPNVQRLPRQFSETSTTSQGSSDSKSTLAASGHRLNSLSSVDFASLSDVRSDFGGDLRSPRPMSPVSAISSYTTASETSVKKPYKSESDLDCKAMAEKMKGDNRSWEERQERMEKALQWLKTELGDLRVLDKQLLEDLNKCQDTIETIKKQRADQIREFDEDIGEEEEGHWEDWEIAEFDRKCKEAQELEENKNNMASSDMKPQTGAKSCQIHQDIQAVL